MYQLDNLKVVTLFCDQEGKSEHLKILDTNA